MQNVGSWQHAASLFAHMLTHYINIHISGQDRLAPSFLSLLLDAEAATCCARFKGGGRNPTEVGERGKSECVLYHLNL